MQNTEHDNKEIENLFEKLNGYSRSGIYPFCMPGHKRQNRLPKGSEDACGVDPYMIDITEVEGFDDLHHASGILKDITEKIADVYISKAPDPGKINFLKSFMSVNGSTACNLAAVNAIPGCKKVLVAANCHRSVFNGAKISDKEIVNLKPAWIDDMELYGGISARDVEDVLKKDPDIKAVVITSPTYEGFLSDVSQIAEAVHRCGAYLIVDEAHGAHLPFGSGMPVSALYSGADIVIHSLHKTVGSLNQTALGFVTDEALSENFEEKLLMFMTTSPSYILMASIEQAVMQAAESGDRFTDFQKRLLSLRKKIADAGGARLIDRSITGMYNIFDIDESRLVLYKDGMSGEELYRRFYDEYGLQLEKFGNTYALALTSVWDTDEGFERLFDATCNIGK